jgi:hypothetical protein
MESRAVPKGRCRAAPEGGERCAVRREVDVPELEPVEEAESTGAAPRFRGLGLRDPMEKFGALGDHETSLIAHGFALVPFDRYRRTRLLSAPSSSSF